MLMSLPGLGEKPLLLHNPRCSKSRRALEILESQGAIFQERRYLDHPLSVDELYELMRRLGCSPKEWVRRKEKMFEEVGLSEGSDDGELIDAIAFHPVLLERPIFIEYERAVIGRPPEVLFDVLLGKR